jgi:hypothetical protein
VLVRWGVFFGGEKWRENTRREERGEERGEQGMLIFYHVFDVLELHHTYIPTYLGP